jgi:hypothetical protein
LRRGGASEILTVSMVRVVRYCSRVCRPLALALTLAATPLAAADEPAPAAPPDDRARLEAIYGAANDATSAGDFAEAADRYAEALALLPESLANHESRALALLDSVSARREAFTRTRDPAQLCRARDLLRAYLITAHTTHGTAAAELDGPRQAGKIHGEIEIQIAADLAPETCPGDQAKPAPAPPPEPEPVKPPPPPRRDPRRVAGFTLLGVAGGSLALMGAGLGIGASAESHGAAAHMDDPARDIDDLLADGFYQRGVAANRLAIAGAVIAGVALTTGAALLIASRVRPKSAQLGLGGLGLRLRF